MFLDRFNAAGFSRGRSWLIEAIWSVVSAFLVSSWIPGSRWRRVILRGFGAVVGKGVILKPGVKIKFPWRIRIGDHSWIGESVWIDNHVMVRIGQHVCLSQGAYLCAGSHDWSVADFDLITDPIEISNHVWIGAFACVPAGCQIGEGAVLTMASRAGRELCPWTIYSGVPAQAVEVRQIRR